MLFRSLLHHDLREMRPARHPAAARFRLFDRDVEAQLAQPDGQPLVAFAARGLQLQHPFAERAEPVRAQEIAQQVCRMIVQVRGKLDAANEFDARPCRGVARLVITGKSIVIGDPEAVHTGPHSFSDQLFGRTTAVGFIGVGVQIDHGNPSVPV